MGKKREDFRTKVWYNIARKGGTSAIEPEEILHQLHCIATADVTRLMKARDGQLIVADTDALDENLRAAIASIEKGTGGLKVKFYDKLKALELLGKHMGLFDGSGEPAQESPLLQTLQTLGQEEVDLRDIPEAEQTAAAGYDLVESTEEQGP